MSDLISIVDADPELGELLDDDDRERARREALTGVRRLSPGAWKAIDALEPDCHHRGFLIIEGLLCREVEVLGRRCAELISDADVLRPWVWDADGSHVKAEVGWTVLEPTKLAVLDHRLVARMNPWPQLGEELFSRGTRRAHSLAVALAIAHHPKVEDRLLLTLWHLGERWGKVRRDGIAVPLPLSHERLATLVGAHRPTVTSAMGDLARAGAVSRDQDGVWVLHGSPPAELRHHRLVAALTSPRGRGGGRPRAARLRPSDRVRAPAGPGRRSDEMPEERQCGEDRDQEEQRVDYHPARDGDDQQHDGQCKKHGSPPSSGCRVVIH